MFKSLGNVLANPHVGLLFIDFEKPNRLRVTSSAAVSDDDPLLAQTEGAQLMVRVTAEHIFDNCPRYIHRMQKVLASRYVPRENVVTPLAGWKRIDIIQDVLPGKDQGRAEKEGGLVTIEDS